MNKQNLSELIKQVQYIVYMHALAMENILRLHVYRHTASITNLDYKMNDSIDYHSSCIPYL